MAQRVDPGPGLAGSGVHARQVQQPPEGLQHRRVGQRRPGLAEQERPGLRTREQLVPTAGIGGQRRAPREDRSLLPKPVVLLPADYGPYLFTVERIS